MVSTWSFGRRGHEAAWPALAAGGSSLDAVETAGRAVEADPEIDSVGLGGLPDRDGRMTFDAAVMTAPDRCGGVCAVARHLHAVSLARRVMETTGHVLLAGPGADGFGAEEGFPPRAEGELLHEAARRRWERWRQGQEVVDQSVDRSMMPVDRGEGGALFGPGDPPGHDTIGVLAIDRAGVMAGACSTSGTPFKHPGRIGDSPIIGHGLYVDPAAGGATGTGEGELISGVCGCFLAVECMRRGASPADAVREVLERIGGAYRLEPHHQVGLVVLRPDGAWASGSLRPGFLVAVRTPAIDDVIAPDVVTLP
jgi:isoaspartyl peptidase/L-asparaginase-like protein (Ntn-hydrolase superfamily)